MAAFNLENYAPVAVRIEDFYREFPSGSIRTFLVSKEGAEVVFEARVFRSVEEATAGIYTSGFAHEVEGKSPVNKTSHVENAETSAVGRALANLGYSGSIGGKKAARPSREEMHKVERRQEDSKEDRLAARLRELGAEVDALRQQKQAHLSERSAAHSVEDVLQSADCTADGMTKYGKRLNEEREKLLTMEDPTSYETYVAPGLDPEPGLPFP